MSTHDELVEKIKLLNETVWESQLQWPVIEDWLRNFSSDPSAEAEEQLHALFLLSQFMYFGRREMRELLRSLFRDLYRYPIIESIRRANGDTTDAVWINAKFAGELAGTRFLGVGNPSESGTHLLYYFRQVNGLSSELFMHTHRIFTRNAGKIVIRDPSIRRYVFIDDFCGSGTQAVQYSLDVVDEIKALDPSAHISYYVLFATKEGLSHVRDNTTFDEVNSIFILDESYRCFSDSSRYFRAAQADIQKDTAEQLAIKYGLNLWPNFPLGYKDGQLLIAFYHNTPDNTLPIFWYADPRGASWAPIFRRYPKLYNWGGI